MQVYSIQYIHLLRANGQQAASLTNKTIQHIPVLQSRRKIVRLLRKLHHLPSNCAAGCPQTAPLAALKLRRRLPSNASGVGRSVFCGGASSSAAAQQLGSGAAVSVSINANSMNSF